MTIRYCCRCILPETKPDLRIDEEGVCNACRNYERRPEKDWDALTQQLKGILDQYRSTDGSNYDCVVPGSGGKDSTFQVIKMLEMGVNPLVVYAPTILRGKRQLMPPLLPDPIYLNWSELAD